MPLSCVVGSKEVLTQKVEAILAEVLEEGVGRHDLRGSDLLECSFQIVPFLLEPFVVTVELSVLHLHLDELPLHLGHLLLHMTVFVLYFDVALHDLIGAGT